MTGGAKGIGRGIAERFGEAGAKVVIADLDEEAGEKTADAICGDFVRTDLSREEEIVSLIRMVVQRYGRADVLVNNAGIYPSSQRRK